MIGNQNTALRIVNAERNFAELIAEFGNISAHDASKVAAYYINNKLAKIDPIIGRVNVKHGFLLDADVIGRALIATS